MLFFFLLVLAQMENQIFFLSRNKTEEQSGHVLRHANSEKGFVLSISTECFTDLDNLNLVKLCNGGLALGSSKYLPLPQVHQEMMLDLKVVKNDTKIIISMH